MNVRPHRTARRAGDTRGLLRSASTAATSNAIPPAAKANAGN